MQYNTQQKRMPLPEYGRSIQNMVDHALTIEDRAERQRCANTIINIMGNMFPMMLMIVFAQRWRSARSSIVSAWSTIFWMLRPYSGRGIRFC